MACARGAGVRGRCWRAREVLACILFRLRRVLVLARLGEPLRVLLRLVHVEARFVEQRGWFQLAMLRAHDIGGRVDLA